MKFIFSDNMYAGYLLTDFLYYLLQLTLLVMLHFSVFLSHILHITKITYYSINKNYVIISSNTVYKHKYMATWTPTPAYVTKHLKRMQLTYLIFFLIITLKI